LDERYPPRQRRLRGALAPIRSQRSALRLGRQPQHEGVTPWV